MADEPPNGHNAAGLIRSAVERIERLNEEQKALSNDKRDIYVEMRSHGLDVKALKEVIKIRAQDVNERKEHEAIVETYLAAIGCG